MPPDPHRPPIAARLCASIKPRVDHIARPPTPARRSLSPVMGSHEREESPGRSRSERRVGARLCKDVLASRRGKTTLRTGRDCVFTWTRDTAIVAIELAAARCPSSRCPAIRVRSDYAGTRPAAPVNGCGPKSPDSHQVVWGLISRPPVSRPGFPAVSRLPTRALPLRPPSSGFPSSAFLRFPFVRRCPVRLPVGFPSGSQIAHICADDRRCHTHQPAVHSGGSRARVRGQ